VLSCNYDAHSTQAKSIASPERRVIHGVWTLAAPHNTDAAVRQGRSHKNLPGGWPAAPALYDSQIGMQNFQEGMEKLEFTDHLGFDWISFSEHHYSYNSVAPHPVIVAARMVDRIKQARLAMLAPVLPLNNPVRVAVR
jgi:hypothetical protein